MSAEPQAAEVLIIARRKLSADEDRRATDIQSKLFLGHAGNREASSQCMCHVWCTTGPDTPGVRPVSVFSSQTCSLGQCLTQCICSPLSDLQHSATFQLFSRVDAKLREQVR